MRANTGGQVAPKDVIGRDRLIERIWRALENQSVVLTAARRMGKTSIIKKMAAEPKAGFLPVYHDLEGLRSPIEFVETVYTDVEKFLTARSKVAKRARDFISQWSGAEFRGVKIPSVLAPHWKTLLQNVMEDLAEHQSGTILFLWDEMPMMLENIRTDSGETVAMEVLDTLRAIRQTFSGIRMIYTGSIGLHHVLTTLKRSGYANAPTNDMKTMDVPPLAAEDATRLAHALLEGEQISTVNRESLALLIAQSVDNVAFYVHQIVDSLTEESTSVSTATIESVVIRCLTASQDPWGLSHYEERIRKYYLPEERPLAFEQLDALALSEQPLSQEALFQGLETGTSSRNREEMREVLSLLQRDHYLELMPEGTYRFYLPLIRRWWRLRQGLGS